MGNLVFGAFINAVFGTEVRNGSSKKYKAMCTQCFFDAKLDTDSAFNPRQNHTVIHIMNYAADFKCHFLARIPRRNAEAQISTIEIMLICMYKCGKIRCYF